MRTFATILTSVVAGVLLWWIAAIVGTALFSGMGIPDEPALLPGYLYTYLASGTFFAVKYALIGIPVCVAIVGVVVVVNKSRHSQR